MSPLTRKQQTAGFFAWMAATFVASAMGSAATIRAGSFYADLVRPEWAPPSSVFGPVWTALYVLMAIAAWLVWRAGGFNAARTALTLFLIQLVFNALWSWLFFGWRLGVVAFIEVVLLWMLIVATLIAFWRVRPLAGAMLLPYLAWVSFASALNYSLWQLNPSLLG